MSSCTRALYTIPLYIHHTPYSHRFEEKKSVEKLTGEKVEIINNELPAYVPIMKYAYSQPHCAREEEERSAKLYRVWRRPGLVWSDK